MKLSKLSLLITTLALSACGSDDSNSTSDPVKVIEVSTPEAIEKELVDGEIKEDESVTFNLPNEKLTLADGDDLVISGSLTLK
ncbi:hypothetical protein PVK63_12140 [Aliivibrio sp. S2TY2]|uniref:hypothetical protein n=1 Tax=unclassified Aliivibrio TaxID=2645654 RepID=UPI002378C11C|nr:MULTISPECIES: hypothetical protein [unclassified Aliivibrio]MDD9175735.1 hypothetical protein [Aliivibrio sp. S3TY1]MDD9192691.1 hypothetical protein [Aliivibrio sp. S2TY2]